MYVWFKCYDLLFLSAFPLAYIPTLVYRQCRRRFLLVSFFRSLYITHHSNVVGTRKIPCFPLRYSTQCEWLRGLDCAISFTSLFRSSVCSFIECVRFLYVCRIFFHFNTFLVQNMLCHWSLHVKFSLEYTHTLSPSLRPLTLSNARMRLLTNIIKWLRFYLHPRFRIHLIYRGTNLYRERG